MIHASPNAAAAATSASARYVNHHVPSTQGATCPVLADGNSSPTHTAGRWLPFELPVPHPAERRPVAPADARRIASHLFHVAALVDEPRGFERVLAFDPQHVIARLRLGALRLASGLLASAEEHFVAVLVAVGPNVAALDGLTGVHLARGDAANAAITFRQARDLDAADLRALGASLRDSGRRGAHDEVMPTLDAYAAPRLAAQGGAL